MRYQHVGFTLIELLVVITIIVVLLALLTPALDKAIYQAQLAVCGTRLHGIGVGSQTYAASFKRAYPVRVAAVWPQELSDVSMGIDDRPEFRDYIPINDALLCPLIPAKIDIANPAPDELGRKCNIYSSYVLWFGFDYEFAAQQSRAMRKLGDRWSYQDTQNTQISIDSDLVAMDSDCLDPTNGTAVASHPDAAEVMTPWVDDNQKFAPDAISFALTSNTTYVFSWWHRTDGLLRGTIDNQYLHGDGSVQRINKVSYLDYEKDIVILPIQRYNGHPYRIQTPSR